MNKNRDLTIIHTIVNLSLNDKKETTGDSLSKLIEICSVYKDDKSYVYKMCNDYLSSDTSDKWLVVMQKLIDTQTDEAREDVVNKDCAKFRANKLKVVRIIDINNLNVIKNSIIDYCDFRVDESPKCTIYTVGKNVKCHTYDTKGIYYFNTIEPAYYFRPVPKNYEGQWITWYNNGQKYEECYYLNGKKDLFISYFPDGSYKKILFF